jgi:hypothetical protein
MTIFAGKLADLRLRMSNVKAKIHKTLMDMFQAVSQGSMEPSELEEKLSSLEGLTGSTSAKTASSGERKFCCGRKHSCSAHIQSATPSKATKSAVLQACSAHQLPELLPQFTVPSPLEGEYLLDSIYCTMSITWKR